jgi:hypothetical protein
MPNLTSQATWSSLEYTAAPTPTPTPGPTPTPTPTPTPSNVYLSGFNETGNAQDAVSFTYFSAPTSGSGFFIFFE